ncbi:hypothetical protein HF325_001333 [Metschnikowia pulcherrima]|uniref:SWI/SNF complex subunit SWI3 n=1 Tax=Metschnikowia pulcherrima TaxID=27326 RepID=A0A8H7LDS8_9ASCO|nr:hypothetical protein HF325_001333 [Metschnikowia pulcherrima]
MSDSEMMRGLLSNSDNNMDDEGIMNSKSPAFYNMDMDIAGETQPQAAHEYTSHTQNSGGNEPDFGAQNDWARDQRLLEGSAHEFLHSEHAASPDASRHVSDEDNLFASGENMPEWENTAPEPMVIDRMDQDTGSGQGEEIHAESPGLRVPEQTLQLDEHSSLGPQPAHEETSLPYADQTEPDFPAETQHKEAVTAPEQDTAFELDEARLTDTNTRPQDEMSQNFFAQEALSSREDSPERNNPSEDQQHDIDMDSEHAGSSEAEKEGVDIDESADSKNLSTEPSEEIKPNGSAKSSSNEVKVEDAAKNGTEVEITPESPRSRDTQPVDIDANDKTRIRQTHAIIVPSYAAWFNMKKIHQIERDSLPEFFETTHPSKLPVIYADYRNFMVNAYRLNPNEYLTLTSCRRTLVGDVGTLMRVHRFLNKWGLINYQVNPQFKPAYALEKTPDGKLVGLPYCGDFHVQYDTPRGLFPFNTYKPMPGNWAEIRKKRIEDNMLSDTTDSEEPAAKKQRVGDWSPTELANLLMGIETHKNDWYMIAKMVGGHRTPQECILKFLKMPIEDPYNKLSEKDLGILKYASNFPVLSADNPVISNLIFMTNLVDAEVVRAASGNASKTIDETLFLKELNKLDVKMKKVGELEKIFERERKNLAQQQNEVFVDRLALTRSTISITKKLNEVVRMLKPSTGDRSGNEEQLSSVMRILADVQSLLYKPVKHSLKEAAESHVTETSELGGEAEKADVVSSDLSKPVSVVEPQKFKVWEP